MSASRSRLIEPVHDDQILSIIRTSFGAQAEVAGCRFIGGGHFNTSYDIETRNPAQRVVLRIAPRGDQPLFRYERTMMLAEPAIYAAIRQAGVPTSAVLAVDGSRSVIGRDYIILKYIDAVPMNHASVDGGVRPRLRREIGRYMARMHGIVGDRFGWIMPDGSVRGSDSWAEVFGELLAETVAKDCEVGVLTSADADAALGCYQDRRAVFDECRTPVLVHNDIWDPNVLVQRRNGEWQIEAIIDADRALFADREFEFALWDGTDDDLAAGYGTPLDTSANAALRREFYRMQLYMAYAWFYSVNLSNPEFQASCQKTALGILRELAGGRSEA